MTARESYFFEKVCDQYNKLFLQHEIVKTERDTFLQENNLLRDELQRTYRELAEIRGEKGLSPVEKLFLSEEEPKATT
jgi:hypothetical protein